MDDLKDPMIKIQQRLDSLEIDVKNLNDSQLFKDEQSYQDELDYFISSLSSSEKIEHKEELGTLDLSIIFSLDQATLDLKREKFNTLRKKVMQDRARTQEQQDTLQSDADEYFQSFCEGLHLKPRFTLREASSLLARNPYMDDIQYEDPNLDRIYDAIQMAINDKFIKVTLGESGKQEIHRDSLEAWATHFNYEWHLPEYTAFKPNQNNNTENQQEIEELKAENEALKKEVDDLNKFLIEDPKAGKIGISKSNLMLIIASLLKKLHPHLAPYYLNNEKINYTNLADELEINNSKVQRVLSDSIKYADNKPQ